MEGPNTAPTPKDRQTTPDVIPDNEALEDPSRNKLITASLSYPTIGTRPDIAFTTSALSQYSTQPPTAHPTAAIPVIQY